MEPLELDLGTRVLVGAGLADSAGERLRALGATRVLLVTDAGLVAAGHAARVERSLGRAGLVHARHDAVREDPSEADVEACAAALAQARPEAVLALGGGSAIDTAKGALFLASGGGRMRDYLGLDKGRGDFLPLMALPTTAGTGSEVQSYALIAHDQTHVKMACGDRRARPRLVLLDESLSVSMPRSVTASSGLDALVHALETAVSTAANALSRGRSARALEQIERGFERALARPTDLEARRAMLLGAAYAGAAIEASMLGAAHAMANPISATLPIAHGTLVALCARVVLPYNAELAAPREAYAELARASGLVPEGTAVEAAWDRLWRRVLELCEHAGLARDANELGLARLDPRELARGAATQWTGRFNPRPVDEAAFQLLYERLLASASERLA